MARPLTEEESVELELAEELADEVEVHELFYRYADATGEDRPQLPRRFSKVDIALAVVRAELAA